MRATISRRRLSVAALVLTGALMAAAAPAGAQTADPWTPCTGFAGFQCSSLTVPLDGSGTVPGTVILQTSRVVAASNPTNTAVVGLAGGPGQAALPLREDFATVMKSAIATRDLLIFDQRGTGESGSLQCLSIRSAITLLKAVTGCANELGPARGFYRTSDSVADIEAMRVAYGYDKLVLFGVSYGTKVAEAAGGTIEDAVRCGIYVTDMATFSQVNDAYAGFFNDAPPARSTIGVAALPLGADVEVDAIIAVTPSS